MILADSNKTRDEGTRAVDHLRVEVRTRPRSRREWLIWLFRAAIGLLLFDSFELLPRNAVIVRRREGRKRLYVEGIANVHDARARVRVIEDDLERMNLEEFYKNYRVDPSGDQIGWPDS